MKVIHGSLPDEQETTGFKTCPICGSVCFADMNTCFGCLHQFNEPQPALAEQEGTTPPLKSGNSFTDEDISSFFVKASELGASEPEIAPAKLTEAGSPVRPSAQGAIELGSGNEEHVIPIEQHEDEMTAHHVCSDKEGRQFEISISIKML